MPDRRSAERSARDVATVWAFNAGWRLVRVLPEAAAYAAFQRAADQIWSRRGPGIVQLEKNLSRVRPDASGEELRELSRAGMRSYLRYWCDTFRLPSWSRERISSFRLDNVHYLDDAMTAGTGALMVVNHAGNWDHAGAWACLRYGGLTTVAERLKPEALYEQFLEFRTGLGMDILPLGDASTFRTLARALNRGALVPLLGDRDISRNGVEVDFFGEKATMPAGPAILGMLTGAPVHPVTLWFEPQGAVGCMHPAIPMPTTGSKESRIATVTQGIAAAFEQGIAAHPEDWHVLQPLWAADVVQHEESR